MRVVAASLVIGLFVIDGVGAVSPDPGIRRTETRSRPNILVIVTDDQRAGTVRHMRKTKRIFGRGGTTFANAFTTTPACCPARASILTGRYPHNHGVRTALDQHRSAAERAEETMVQATLHRSGYRTALYGKYLNNWDIRRSPAALDDWAIFTRSQPFGYRDGIWNVNGRVTSIRRYSTRYLRARAATFLENQEVSDGRPWFLYLAPAAPHAPFEAEPRYRDAPIPRWPGNPAVRERDRTDKPPWVQERFNGPRRGRRVRADQLRTLLSVDDLVGVLFRMLKRLGENRRTLAIYTSDNGFVWSEHGLGTKRWPYLQSPKIPLMVRWPNTVHRGLRDDRLVVNIDIAPTIADAADVELPARDGRSLLSEHRRERLLLEYFRTPVVNPPTWASTLTPEYQYIEYYDENDLLLHREYYDLATDPWQLVNLLGDIDPTNDPPVTDQSELSLQLGNDRSCSGPDECP